MDFDRFQLHPTINSGLKALGFTVPTPIQQQAIPHGLNGKDILGLAQTGTGKTAAFALPILQRLASGPRNKVRALVVAPTRELAEQIHESFRSLGRDTGLRSATVYGGVGMNPQVAALRGKAEIIVACPGRLLDHLNQNTANLSGVEILVLDEADQMMDMGFLPSIRQLLKRVPAQRQTMLFSATMPDQIRHLTRECLRDPVTIQIDHQVPLATVTHALYPVAEHLKTDLLLELLRLAGAGSILVFTRTKHRAKKLDKKLQDAGYKAASLQGNLSQNRRKEALDGFRDGSYQVLVATDIAARGIDVSQISHVINYDVPMTAEAYTHRIGRTGRAAKTGDAFTLVTVHDAPLIRQIERLMNQKLPTAKLQHFDYNKAPSHEPAPQGRIQHPRGRPAFGHGGQQRHGGGQQRHGGGGSRRGGGR